jgi:hypothetical protein
MTGGKDASQKHRESHGQSADTGILQYFRTHENPLHNNDPSLFQGKLVLRLNRKVHRVGPSPPPATASDEWLVGGPMNLLSVSEH